MNILVRGKPGATTGTLSFEGETIACALGRSGIIANEEKTEGDGATPAGVWPLHRILFRPDRLAEPASGLPVNAINSSDGWCDDPTDAHYNQPVKLPYPASTESLWRNDELYNICVILGHNDDPVVPYRGSAIFFHVAKEKDGELSATEGCVALPQKTLVRLLTKCGPGTTMDISLEN